MLVILRNSSFHKKVHTKLLLVSLPHHLNHHQMKYYKHLLISQMIIQRHWQKQVTAGVGVRYGIISRSLKLMEKIRLNAIIARNFLVENQLMEQNTCFIIWIHAFTKSFMRTRQLKGKHFLCQRAKERKN
jgi:hypothetical protein